MSRPDIGEAKSRRMTDSRGASGVWGPVFIWIAGVTIASTLAAWWLLPETSGAFSSVNNSLPATFSAPPSHSTCNMLVPASECSTPAPSAGIAGKIQQASKRSATILVETRSNRVHVLPVRLVGRPSLLLPLLAVAALTFLAGLGSAMLGRRRPRSGPPQFEPDDLPATVPAETELVASRELRHLRLGAQQKAVLARSVAELVPSMPEALSWQAEKALAEVGVRRVVPDGEPFDAAVHHAVGIEPVPRGGRENAVARTLRPGYSDDEKILVYPRVVVYAETDGLAQ
jgi:GrpE